MCWASRGSFLTTGAAETAYLHAWACPRAGALGGTKKQYGTRGGAVFCKVGVSREDPREAKNFGGVDKTNQNDPKVMSCIRFSTFRGFRPPSLLASIGGFRGRGSAGGGGERSRAGKAPKSLKHCPCRVAATLGNPKK